ncbi:MAG: tetratricopeptide repeat protein, partial [bacterium]|nr:tetratricopeptide repeat protein [bacterium]
MVFIKKKKHKSSAEIESDKQEKALLKAGIVDEFQTKGFETIGFLRHHKIPALLALAVVSVLTLAVFSWVFYGRVSNEEASEQYSKAVAMIANQTNLEPNPEQLKAGRDALLAVATDHPSSSVGNLAVLYAAHISLEINDNLAAVEEYQRFLKATSKNNALRPLALSGLAQAFEATNDLVNALKT